MGMTVRQRLREVFDGTQTARQLAELIGAKPDRVRKIAKDEGFKLARAENLGNAEEKWTMAQKEQLSFLWAEGLSITKIGLELGLSRNSVVGKANRMGLPRRGSPIKQAPKGQPVSVDIRRLPLPPTPSVRATAYHGPGMPLAERKMSGECGWIIGEPAEFRCCGAPTWQGSSWCEFHFHKVFRQPTDIPRNLRLPGEKKRKAA